MALDICLVSGAFMVKVGSWPDTLGLNGSSAVY